MKKPTLKDIADAAGISVAAVSMILAGKGKISPAVSGRVRALAEEMGYQRRSTADRPGARKFKYVCILQCEDFPYLWNFSNPFVSFLEEQVVKMGYYPFILHIPNNADPRTVFKEIVGAHAGAVFALHYADAQLFENLEKAAVPVILINNGEYQTRFWSVMADEVQGAYEATMHLVEMGHRVIAYADYFRPTFTILVNDRYFGYRKALVGKRSRLYGRSQDISGSRRLRDPPEKGSRSPSLPCPADGLRRARRLLRRLPHRGPEACGQTGPEGHIHHSDRGRCPGTTRCRFIPKINTMQIDRRLIDTMAWSLLESRLSSRQQSVQVLKQNPRCPMSTAARPGSDMD